MNALAMQFPDRQSLPLVVGIASVDKEHAELVAEIGLLIGPPMLHLDSEHFSEFISRLWCRLAEHFDHEEAIIRSCGMPATEVTAHLRAHREILEQYTSLQLDRMSRSTLDQEKVVDMIKSWIVDHLLAYDAKLQSYASAVEPAL